MGTRAASESPDLDPNGFLGIMAAWDRAEAQRLAYEHEIGPLTEDHWKVIDFVRAYYRTYRVGPPVVRIHRETGLSSGAICRLFPCGMVKGAYRVSGMPRPPGCA